MRHYNAHHNENGFTLLELIVVMLFAGILAAISAPSFIGLNQINKVNHDLSSAKNSLLEAQRGAMRRGQDCTLFFSDPGVVPATISIADSHSGNCLSGDSVNSSNLTQRIFNNVSMTVYQDGISGAISHPTLTFDYLGNNTTAITTIVLQSQGNFAVKKCLVISQPLGLIATNKYTGSSATYSSNCTP
jgi:prepilin-type N-terminal cleavage/methylation domain-containing protein